MSIEGVRVENECQRVEKERVEKECEKGKRG